MRLVLHEGVSRNVRDSIDNLVANPSLLHEVQEGLGRNIQAARRLARP